MSDVLQQKVKETLAVRLHSDPRLLLSLESLSSSSSQGALSSGSIRHSVELASLAHVANFESMLAALESECKALDSAVRDVVRVASSIESNSRLVTNPVGLSSSSSSSSSSSNPSSSNPSLLLAAAISSRDAALDRESAVKTFVSRFELAGETSAALSRVDVDLWEQKQDARARGSEGSAFLRALEDVGRARDGLAGAFGSGKITHEMGGVAGPDSSALSVSLLDSLSARQEAAYEKLYMWIQQYLRLGDFARSRTPHSPPDLPYFDPFVSSSLRALAARPAYLVHILELLVIARRTAITGRFLQALTPRSEDSNSGGMVGAGGAWHENNVLFKSDDPVGYVGDVLAWLHRELNTEVEVVAALYGEGEEEMDEEGGREEQEGGDGATRGQELAGGSAEGQDKAVGEDDGDSAKAPTASEVVRLVLEGLARPFKSRVLSVVEGLSYAADDAADNDELASRYKILSLYGICGMLEYYRVALNKAARRARRYNPIGAKAPKGGEAEDESSQSPIAALGPALDEVLSKAKETYVANLKVHGESLQRLVDAEMQSQSLSKIDTVASFAVNIISQIAETRLSSPGFSLVAAGDEDGSGGSLDGSGDVPTDPLGMNLVLQLVLGPAITLTTNVDDMFLLTAAVDKAVEGGGGKAYAGKWRKVIDDRVAGMVESLVKHGADAALKRCGLRDVVAFVRDKGSAAGLEAGVVRAALESFNRSLASPLAPTFEEVREVAFRAQARNEAKKAIVVAYGVLHAAICAAGRAAEFSEALLYSPEQVEALVV